MRKATSGVTATRATLPQTHFRNPDDTHQFIGPSTLQDTRRSRSPHQQREHGYTDRPSRARPRAGPQSYHELPLRVRTPPQDQNRRQSPPAESDKVAPRTHFPHGGGFHPAVQPILPGRQPHPPYSYFAPPGPPGPSGHYTGPYNIAPNFHESQFPPPRHVPQQALVQQNFPYPNPADPLYQNHGPFQPNSQGLVPFDHYGRNSTALVPKEQSAPSLEEVVNQVKSAMASEIEQRQVIEKMAEELRRKEDQERAKREEEIRKVEEKARKEYEAERKREEEQKAAQAQLVAQALQEQKKKDKEALEKRLEDERIAKEKAENERLRYEREAAEQVKKALAAKEAADKKKAEEQAAEAERIKKIKEDAAKEREEQIKAEEARKKEEAEKEAARAATVKRELDALAKLTEAKTLEQVRKKQAQDEKAAAEKAAEEKKFKDFQAEIERLKKDSAEEKAKIEAENAKAKKEADEEFQKIAKQKDETINKLLIPDMTKKITFTDALRRKYLFPFELAKTWAGLFELIAQAFKGMKNFEEAVQHRMFDLIGPNGESILPEYWEYTIKPDMCYSMQLWPINDARRMAMGGSTAPPPPPPTVPRPVGPPGHKSRRRQPGVLSWIAGKPGPRRR